MKKHLIFLLITFCFVSALYAQKLTVASYNIRYENQGDADKGNGWKQRCPVITQLILFHNFDIFGAQEVLHGQLTDMLGQLPGYAYIGVGRSDGKNEGEFAPIFYKEDKFKLLQSGHFWLSETQDKPNVGWDAALPRICTWGKFKLKDDGNTFWFFNLHLDHKGVNARLESSKLVIQKIREMCGKDPVVLTGDFNVDQTSEGYKILCSSELLRDSYELAEIRYALNGTANAFNPNLKTDSRIDHIFVSKGFNVQRYGVLTDSYRSETSKSSEEIKSGNFPKELTLHQYDIRLPSDHYPVQVDMKFE
ncbi:MAG: endonuclease [Bacteroidetes bacterium GWF2_42_66]|nr:MAG: endonuclease [Bacteroidetes bacterium GWA2_42_15]OFX98826.1 MAG: endonuclease [Bacteroidetes bacterium GWE2_42_39]OFY43206.1 MAG: endonuclease [Bacteroidetes bacterium GWF2_42_66]HBL77024.1 endonuclease [Prolixibacteraceae bacterium]HCR90115.1 endonuclease [Prolixibacteraceae bacterium]